MASLQVSPQNRHQAINAMPAAIKNPESFKTRHEPPATHQTGQRLILCMTTGPARRVQKMPAKAQSNKIPQREGATTVRLVSIFLAIVSC